MSRLQSSHRGDGLARRVVLAVLVLAVASLGAAPAGGSPAAGSTGPAPAAESYHASPAPPVDGVAAANSARPRLAPRGPWIVALGLAAGLAGRAPILAARSRPGRGVPVVRRDVGDRWRALLIGAPPGSLSS